jgi:hypothetical protein
MLRTPEAIHPSRATVADRRAQSADRPHSSVSRAGAAADRRQTRRQWVLRWRGGHHRAPRTEAKPGVPRARLAEVGTELAGRHGGEAAQAMAAAKEARMSTARWRRCWCSRPKRERRWRELRPRAPANGGHGG